MIPLGFYDDENDEDDDSLSFSTFNIAPYSTKTYNETLIDIIKANNRRYYTVIFSSNYARILMYDDINCVYIYGYYVKTNACTWLLVDINGYNQVTSYATAFNEYTVEADKYAYNLHDQTADGISKFQVYSNADLVVHGVTVPSFIELQKGVTNENTFLFAQMVFAFILILYVFKSAFSRWRTY